MDRMLAIDGIELIVINNCNLGMYLGVEMSRAAREKLGIGSVKSSNEPSLNELEPELEPKLQLVY